MKKLYRRRGNVGKLYPGGEYSWGYDHADYTAERGRSRTYDRHFDMQSVRIDDDNSVPDAVVSVEAAAAAEIPGAQEQLDALTLGLSDVRNSDKKRGRYGSDGISREAARKIKASGYLIEERYGKRRLSFGTITIPTMGTGERRWLNANWSAFCEAIYRQIRRQLDRRGFPTEIVGVTEVQQERYEASGDIYLHLHFVCVGIGFKRGDFAITHTWLRRTAYRTVIRLLRDYWREGGLSPSLSYADFSACEEIRAVKKSVASYLGKYLSKGTTSGGRYQDSVSPDELPRHWWYSSYPIKRRLSKSMVHLDRDIIEVIHKAIEPNDELCLYCRHIKHQVAENFIVTFGVGRLSKKGISQLHSYMEMF